MGLPLQSHCPLNPNLLNSYFFSCFSTQASTFAPAIVPSFLSELSTIQCLEEEVVDLSETQPFKYNLLYRMFNLSLSTGHSSMDWKSSNRTPVYKVWRQELGIQLQTHLSSPYSVQGVGTHRPQQSFTPPYNELNHLLLIIWLQAWQLNTGGTADCYGRLAEVPRLWVKFSCSLS